MLKLSPRTDLPDDKIAPPLLRPYLRTAGWLLAVMVVHAVALFADGDASVFQLPGHARGGVAAWLSQQLSVGCVACNFGPVACSQI